MHWMILPFKRFAEFSGRSRRMEYWMFTLLGVIVSIVCYALILADMGPMILDAVNNPDSPPDSASFEGLGILSGIGGLAMLIFGLASIVPSIAVTVRRLHDRNMSGWYYLGFIVMYLVTGILFAPLALLLALGWIVLMALPGTAGPNNYGPDPKDPTNASVFE